MGLGVRALGFRVPYEGYVVSDGVSLLYLQQPSCKVERDLWQADIQRLRS